MTDVIRQVDEQTAATVIKALQDARTRCISPVVALDRAGILLTENLARLVRRDTLFNTAEHLRATKLRQLVEAGYIPKDPAPSVLLKGIADRVEHLADDARRGLFR